MMNAGRQWLQNLSLVSANGSNIVPMNCRVRPTLMANLGVQYLRSIGATMATKVPEKPTGRNRTEDKMGDQPYLDIING